MWQIEHAVGRGGAQAWVFFKYVDGDEAELG